MGEADHYIDESFKKAAKFCEELGLDGVTIANVTKAEDGAFFIQAASMIEAALNSGLAKRISIRKSFGNLDEDGVLKIIERMQMGGANNKVEIALSCDLIAQHHKQLIEAIITIRNLYAHNFKNYGLSFDELYGSLTQRQKTSLQQKFIPTDMRRNLEIGAYSELAMIQVSARIGLVTLIAWIMEYRQPKGLLSLLGWTPEKEVAQSET